MKGDIPQAALNLLAKLPVRTHQYRPRADPGPRIDTRTKRVRRALTGRGRGGLNKRAIWIGKLRFDSVRMALKQCSIGRATLEALLTEGRARYE